MGDTNTYLSWTCTVKSHLVPEISLETTGHKLKPTVYTTGSPIFSQSLLQVQCS